jgi:phosphatidylinositol-3-phosphatase
MKYVTLILTIVAALTSVRPSSAQVPNFRHVFIIVMENDEFNNIIGSPDAPYINRLAGENGLATNAFAVTHPSLPNYMALTGGDTAFTTNCIGCVTPAANIADQIEASGRTWTAYMEDMPAPCATTDSGLYVARHNPFVHYSDVVSNAVRCNSHVVPFSRFSSDLSAGSLSDYIWITPNLCNDMHDCSVATGDAWLASVVPQILQSAAFADSVLFLTFDEGTSTAGGGGQIPLIVASRWTPAGTRAGTTVTHYSLLRTIEDAWSLSPLGQAAAATAMTEFFPRPAAPPAEQVIYAADISEFTGAWTKVADSTAAAGVKLSTPDLGGTFVVPNPQAAPSSYFDATFQASPATRYRVWLRIHPQNDSKWNDSVYVQFSDSVSAQGVPIYRTGTTGGYTVNLWTCATCQSAGWGWQRNAYWLADAGDVWFPAGGAHKIRVQVREDGAEIDQIVISPVTYATNPPGPVSNDTTIVPKPTQAPGTPGMPGSANPPNGTTGVSPTATLSWNAVGATGYDVSFGSANPPPQVSSGQTAASYSPAMTAGTTYYWQIVARNSAGSTAGPVWSFTTTPSVVTHTEIIIYASDIPAAALHGSWATVSDATSPNGVKLATPDAGWASPNNPLASPADYVDVMFTADANRTYALWWRLKASSNSKYNDSMWVQFSDVFAGGFQIYPLNTTSGLNVNLATDAGAASLSNWGWQNGAYWLTQPVTVTFPTSGPHTMRIQVREDGVQFDQIVLSSSRYLTTAPGPVTNDSTIVPKL